MLSNIHRAAKYFSVYSARSLILCPQSSTSIRRVSGLTLHHNSSNDTPHNSLVCGTSIIPVIHDVTRGGSTTTRSLRTSSRCYGITEDTHTKELTVWSSLRQVHRSPVPALTLGLAGLVPFLASPVYMMMHQVYMSSLAHATVVYGAVILSFLGGVRWGFTVPECNPVQPDWVNLGYSVLPPLAGWVGLLLPDPLSVFTVMAGITLVGYCDMAMYGYPPWFKGLRFVLSLVAILALWTTFTCSYLLTEKPDNTEVTSR